MSHSQGREEQVIRSYFGNHVGTFLDIGANDGRTFSNTHALALFGWAGVCVDASPRAFQSLQGTYKENERVHLIHAAVTTKDGTVKLDEASDTLVSSMVPGGRDRWANYGFQWQEVEVPAITFATLLERSPVKTFDVISIDVEDHDIDILKQIDLSSVGCKVLCIEHGDRHASIKAMCPGFRVLMLDGINLILGR